MLPGVKLSPLLHSSRSCIQIQSGSCDPNRERGLGGLDDEGHSVPSCRDVVHLPHRILHRSFQRVNHGVDGAVSRDVSRVQQDGPADGQEGEEDNRPVSHTPSIGGRFRHWATSAAGKAGEEEAEDKPGEGRDVSPHCNPGCGLHRNGAS